MPRHYPAELRRRTCERMLAGEAVKDLVVELGIAQVTLYKWRRQALIDAGPTRERRATRLTRCAQLAGASRSSRTSSSWSGGQRPLSRRAAPTQKEVPGCPRAEQPGLLRTPRLSRSWASTARPTTSIKFRKPNDREIRGSCWPTPSGTSTPAAAAPTASAGQGRPRDRTGDHRQQQAGLANHARAGLQGPPGPEEGLQEPRERRDRARTWSSASSAHHASQRAVADRHHRAPNQRRASSTAAWCSTCSRARWSAGRSTGAVSRHWCSTPSTRREHRGRHRPRR